MGCLHKYAKDTHKEPTEVLSTRVPRSAYNNFKVHCEKYNLSMAEAVSILITQEVSGNLIDSSEEVENLQNEIKRLNSIIDKIITQR